MSKLMQNLVVFMEPSEDVYNISLKRANMSFNRFCIDEEAGFELSGVNFFKKSSGLISDGVFGIYDQERKEKGKEFSFCEFYLL